MHVYFYTYFKTNVRIICIMEKIYFTEITNHISNHTTYFYKIIVLFYKNIYLCLIIIFLSIIIF